MDNLMKYASFTLGSIAIISSLISAVIASSITSFGLFMLLLTSGVILLAIGCEIQDQQNKS